MGGAWVCYEIIDTITDRLVLPQWLPVLAIILFFIGLPFVVATAFVRERVTAEAPTEPTVERAAAPVKETFDAEAARLRAENRRRLLTLRNGLLALVGALAVWGIIATAWLLVGVEEPVSAGPAQDRKMLVVLPFENLGQPEEEYFADGLTEEITSRLAEISGLGVIGRSSAVHYKNASVPIRQIGEELGVDYVLEGTVRWEGSAHSESRVRVTPQLVRVADATHVWTERYEEALAGVFRIQSDIAEQVARAMEITLLEPEREALEANPTENLEAYDRYLRGNDYFDRGFSGENLHIAGQMYEQAVALDPNFALAYAKLSEVHSTTYWYYWDRTDERLARARAAEPDDGELLALLADVYRRQGSWDRALESLLKARNLDPRSSLLPLELGVTYFFQALLEKYE